MQFWNELEGQVIDGRYPLRRLVRSEGRSAWFETETAEDGTRPATISLTESLTDAEEVTGRLQAAQRLHHPSLLAIHKIGRAQLDQTLFVYAVMEHADQNLSDVLRDQALSRDEARQVAEAVVGALTAIHQQGMVHGRVEPASVLAVGEMVKLRSDCLQSPGGTRAGDVAGVGATLFEAFTRRKAGSAEDPEINRIPAPFAEIVRNSLSARWGLAQVAAVLRPPATPAAVSQVPVAAMPVPVAPSASVETVVTPQDGKKWDQDVRNQDLRNQAAQNRENWEQDEDAGDRASRRPVALYTALAVALLVVLGWLILRPKAPRPAQVAAKPGISNPAAPAPIPVPSAKQPAAKMTKPSAGRPDTRQAAQAPAGAVATAPRTVWRVVAYTYHHQDQAQHKTDEINSAHSDLNAAVFSPNGNSGSYLVTIGGAMDRSQAFRMRDKARSMGLPDDTYVQNFRQ